MSKRLSTKKIPGRVGDMVAFPDDGWSLRRVGQRGAPMNNGPLIRVPLRPGPALARTALKRSGFIERKSAIRRVSAKARKVRRVWGAACDARQQLCGGVCEFPGCESPGSVGHHRKARGQGGEHSVSNCAWLCAAHHLRVHINPAESYANGLMIRRGGVA